MTTLKRRLVRIGNKIGVWMYRAFDGRLASYNKGAKVLMITTPGRRTGVLHSTCVRYLDTPEGLLVWGTASGAPSDPDWFRNLRKAKVAEVQRGAKTLQARPHELIGVQRDKAWNDIVLAQAPEVANYAQRAGRTIPVALLEPIQGPLRQTAPID
ncbi:MAG TPA: nitroreductase/quinone reductase family protein [Propionibacteriaceae bacterium]|nr:nitroreductase/quinone reductase family protein [Propionibacteriaceae bacterium]